MKVLSVSAALVAVFMALCADVFAQEAEKTFPYVAEVTAEKTAFVRNGMSKNHLKVYVAKRGEKLVVVGEELGWASVHVPEGVPCWVSDKFVEKGEGGAGKAKGNNVNVRFDRSSKDMGNIVGRLKEGEAVTIVEEKDGWYLIKPPAHFRAFIFAELVKYVEPYAGQAVEPGNTTTGPGKTPDVPVKNDFREELAQARALYDAELEKPIGERDFTSVEAVFQKMAETSDDATVKEKAQMLLEQIALERRATADHLAAMRKIEEQHKRDLENITKGPAKPPFVAQGYLQDTGVLITKYGTHRLVIGRKPVYWLKAADPQMNLDKFRAKLVGIRGVIQDVEGTEEKLIVIEEVELIGD
jgi:uncharacterized protein YgiM (DUF1202 family)